MCPRRSLHEGARPRRRLKAGIPRQTQTGSREERTDRVAHGVWRAEIEARSAARKSAERQVPAKPATSDREV